MKRQVIVIVLIVSLMNLIFIGCSSKSPVGGDPAQMPSPVSGEGTGSYYGDDSSIFGVFGEPMPTFECTEPPPAEALDLLVNEGFMTSEERDLFWDAYYNGIDEGQKTAIYLIICRIIDKIMASRWARMAVIYAVEKTTEWVCDNLGETGSGPNVCAPGGYQRPMAYKK